MRNKIYILIKFSIVLILLNNIIGCEESTEPNHNPVVNSIIAFPNPVQVSDSFAVFCSAEDIDGDPLTYDWFCTNRGASIKEATSDTVYELLNSSSNIMIFNAVDSLIYSPGHATIFCDVRDEKGGLKTVYLHVGIFE
jgi:hypothetical protein